MSAWLTFLAIQVSVFSYGASAQAKVMAPLNLRQTNFIQTQIRQDLLEHLDERLNEVAVKSRPAPSNALSVETQNVLLKGAFLALQARAPFAIDEARFNESMGRVLRFLHAHRAFPQAVTLGVLNRVTVGEGVTAGGSAGIEVNFFLDQGRLMVSNYRLVGAQLGVGTAVAVNEYYAALCFGNCHGGEPGGWYLGFDGTVAGGLGAGFFLEVGVDAGDLLKSYVGGPEVSWSGLYDASAVYVGFGLEVGVGASFSANLYRYDQIGADHFIADLASKLEPRLVLQNSSFLDRAAKEVE